MKTYRVISFIAAVVINLLIAGVLAFSMFDVASAQGSVGVAAAQARGRCTADLEVWLSPDVPDPRSAGFLSSLANMPGYVLTWVGESKSNMSVNLELAGEGPAYLCREEVERIRRDGRVIDLRVFPAVSASDRP